MSPFRLLAAELGTSDRSLRRAANRGLIRAHRTGPRTAEIAIAERAYLRGHWKLLSRLVAALRTEHNVRLAVLFGSTARGDDEAESDIDIAVELVDDDPHRSFDLARRLSRATERAVELVPFAAIRKDRVLLSELARDGRVLIDRESVWDGPWREQVLDEDEVDEYLAELGRGALAKARDYVASVR